MQTVVWVLFGGTLALAGYVSHRRTGRMTVALDPPVAFGSLRVRLPSGWEREDPPKAPPEALVVKERDEEGRRRRELWITQERQAGPKKGPSYYLDTTFKLPDSRPEPFAFLGSHGVLITWRGLPQSLLVDLDEELVEKLPDPGLYACAVLPDGQTVTIQVRGAGAYGPTNQRLIRQVADNLSLSDNASTQPPPSNAQ
jgi:hypothetical protein